ncbi:MAG: DUF3365 domain-containing protein [Pseudomonadales bacterium]|jgi:hypothetical protein|nr:DUF3365 domain-containing protein [Pseudomonadales bacterium]
MTTRTETVRRAALLALAVALATPVGATEPAQALLPFKQALRSALMQGLAEGPVAAVDTCHVVAPGLPDSTVPEAIEVGRASDRLRNPANAPPAWVAPHLEAMLANPSGAAPMTVPLEGERIGYLEPIRVQAPCLVCHGEALVPEVAAAIDARYPEDEARGYALDELRGVFWLTMPAAPAAKDG